MAKRVTLTSDSDEWVFEEGKTATFTNRRRGRSERADFRVKMIAVDNGTLVIATDLIGISRYDWMPIIFWSGPYELVEV